MKYLKQGMERTVVLKQKEIYWGQIEDLSSSLRIL